MGAREGLAPVFCAPGVSAAAFPVAVDEAKRAAFRDAKLKNFDFIVYSSRGTNWRVDIKGRRWRWMTARRTRGCGVRGGGR